VSTPQPHARLRAAIEARAEEPGWSLARIAREAGPIDVQTLWAIRTGKNAPSKRTMRGLDRALGWTDGSTETLLDGGEPVPLSESTHDPAEQKIKDMEHISKEKQQQIIERLRANRQAALEEAAALNEVGRLKGRKSSDSDRPKGQTRSA
jgi:hypothetical protein